MGSTPGKAAVLIFLDPGENQPYGGLVLDGHDTVIMGPPVVSFILEWDRQHVLAYAEYKGWRVRKEVDKDEKGE